MNDPNTQQSNNDERRPNVGLLYLEGLAVYIGHRLADFGYTVIRLLTAPFRWIWTRLEDRWFRLKPWLVKNKRRLLWSILALTFLTFVIGGGVTLYLWRDELLTLAFRWQDHLTGAIAHLRRRTEPVVVVATQVAEEVPAVPSVDGAGN